MKSASPSLCFQPRDPSDDDFIEAVGREAFARWSMRPGVVIRRMLSDCAAHVEVASDDGKRVGFFVLRFERLPRTYMGLVRPLVARVDALAVIRSSRGRGIGRALVERAEYVARREGAVVLTLMTAQSNRRGRRLFASSGFLPLLTWEQGYENGDSGLELWKPLLTGGHSAKR